MASISYNKKTRTFTAVWKDYAKEALGERYPYGRKSEKWQGVKHPSAKEKREVEKRLMTFADDEEHKSKDKADYIRIHGKDDEITATGYLTNLKDEELSISQNKTTVQQARLIRNDFVTWLDINHKKIALHEINSFIASRYYKHLQAQGIAYGTIRKYTNRLRFLFKQVLIKYEDSPLKYKNPFSTMRLDSVIEQVAEHTRKAFTQSQLRDFLHFSMTSERLNKWQILQRFAIYYFLIVTGWRVNDILLMKWQQVDFDKGIIKMTHAKTEKKNIKTELYITELMAEILTALYLMKEYSPNENHDFVFSYWNAGTKKESNWYGCIRANFIKIRQKLNLDTSDKKGKVKTYDYTIHSFRGTVITRLTQAGYNEAMINYLVGHAPRTIEAKHYLSLGSKDTKTLIEHMENLVFAYDESLQVKALQDFRNKKTKSIIKKYAPLTIKTDNEVFIIKSGLEQE